jgi:glycosyltransferase involved in cell wall biosynthesis
MKILIVTDAWFPQVNGVVRTLDTVRREVEALGHAAHVVDPSQFPNMACPTYAEIRLAWARPARFERIFAEHRPDAVHISTEGPLGWSARRFCLRRRIPFSTSYHTRFPEYVQSRFHLPPALTYPIFRRFHAPSHAVMVATDSMRRELTAHGFKNLVKWSRGVDLKLFRPQPKAELPHPRPIILYVGRVSVEKNIEAFLELKTPGTKYVVGDGPQLAALQARYRDAIFLGRKSGEELAQAYAQADVFVFPSKTDTFGLVLLEALACGVPVAAYPVPGPLDIIADSGVGVLSDDLQAAVDRALSISPERCRAHAETYSWRACAEQFISHLQPV